MIRAADPLASRWGRAGAMFNAPPAPASPDLVRLLLDTARAMPNNARLLPVIAPWLVEYGELVPRHRLKALIERELEPAAQPALGLLLETADPLRFASVLKTLRPADTPGPLYLRQAKNAALARRARRNASDLSRRWGVWAAPSEPKPESIRQPAWVMQHNPVFVAYNDFRGDLRASVLSALLHDEASGQSELGLAKAIGATRKATRDALDNLERSGKVERLAGARRTQMRVMTTAA